MNLTDLTPIDANLGRRDLVGGSPIDDVPDRGRCRSASHERVSTRVSTPDSVVVIAGRSLFPACCWQLSRTDEGSDLSEGSRENL